MHLRKMSKIFSVTLAFALIMSQNTYVFAATDESTWAGLKTDVEASAGEYNVTASLTADENGGSNEGTVFITADGNVITGAALTENSTHDPLFNVDGAVTSFSVSNDITGSIVNDGTMTYTGSNMAGGTLSGTGTFVLGGTTANANDITQGEVQVTSAAVVTNTGAVTAALNNSGTISGTGTLDLNADSVNNGKITQSLITVSNGADFLNHGTLTAKTHVLTGNTMASKAADLGGDVENDGTFDLDGDGTLSVNISGTGATKISNTVNNGAKIDQTYIKVKTGAVLNTSATNLTADNSGAANTGIENDGIISFSSGTTANNIYGGGSMDITGYVTNNGDISLENLSNTATFTNNGNITANIHNTGNIQGAAGGKLITGTGVSSNSGNIKQYTLTNNGTFTNTGYVTVTDFTNNSYFETDATLLSSVNTIDNTGLLAITGGGNFNNITSSVSGSGKVSFVKGDSENFGTINQDNVAVSGNLRNFNTITANYIANMGKLTTDAGSIVGDIINSSELIITGGDNANGIYNNTGTTYFYGYTNNTGNIVQNKVVIGNGAQLTSNSDLIDAAIENSGTLFWNGGSGNNNAISGSGNLSVISGNIVNTAAINQNNITISYGTLITNADLITSANGITNTGSDSLTFSGGTNNNAVNGTGSMVISGNVTNKAEINQDGLTVSGGKLTTDADLLNINNAIVNNSGISFTGGVNNNDISGSGTTYIDGTVENMGDISTDITVSTNGHYATTTDVLADVDLHGIIDVVDANINADINGTGTLNILGSTVNNGAIDVRALNIAAGADLSSDSDNLTAPIVNDGTYNITAGTTNTNIISGTGALTISGGNIVNTASVNQNSITISGGSLTSNAGLLVSAGGIINNVADGLTLTGGTNNNAINGTGSMVVTGTVSSKGRITQSSITNSGNFSNSSVITADIVNSGLLISVGDNISGNITNNGTYDIVAGGNANSISGSGLLIIHDETANSGNIAQGNIIVADEGNFKVADIGNVTATSGISNRGIIELQSGTNTNNISGNTGVLKVTGNVTNNSGVSIAQDTVNITSSGILTVDAADLVATQEVANNGSLVLGDGSNANVINGTGSLTVNGTVTNTAAISQQAIANNGTFTTDATLLTSVDGITNSNILNFTQGTNNNTINGTGTTNFSGTSNNNAIITQGTVTNDGYFTNNYGIIADFVNSGITNTTAAITGDITNTSTGRIDTSAGNLNGDVLNDGLLLLWGGTTLYDISGSGNINITQDLTNNVNISQNTIYNSAVMTNNGAVTADVNNSGVINNNALITGTLTNGGTLNSSADYLAGSIVNNATFNVAGGTLAAAVSGSGTMNIIADMVNNVTVAQNTVTNSGNLTNNAAITADTISNSGVITGAAGNLVATTVIDNSGILVFDAASSGASNISGTGSVQVKADTVLSGTNSYTGGTLLDGAALTVAGQNNIGTGTVTFANNGLLDVTAAGSLSNALSGKTAADDVLIQNGAALSLTGDISGAADFHKSGAGDMTFAMLANSYTGDTYVDGGKLIGDTNLIKNAVIGAAGTTVEFTDTADAELNEINTSGTFLKSGSGLLNVKNNAFSAAQVELNDGIFAANRNLTATVLNVNSGATLRGNGNITGTVNLNSGATLAPGNSIDTLTVTGDINFASGSTSAFEINETPASDKLIITGNANIASGANLTVSNENGRYFEWKSFDIIEAANVTGTFTYDGTVANYDASRIEVSLDYGDPSKVVLTAKRKATDYSTAASGLSHNQREVAKAVDAVSTGFGGDITNSLLQLEKLGGLNPAGVTLINPDSTLTSALDDTHGVLYANGALFTLFNAKTAHVYDRIKKHEASVIDCPTCGKYDTDLRRRLASSSKGCPTCKDNFWGEYYSQYDKVYADKNSPSFTNNMTGVLAGYDRSSGSALLGIYGGYGKSDLRQHRSKMDMEDTSLGIYGGYVSDTWVLKGTLLGGYQYYEGSRDIAYMARKADSSYHGWNTALDLETSYNIPLDTWVNFKPFIGVLGSYSHQQAFNETGADALNLRVKSNSQFNAQARLGAELDGKIQNRLSWYGSAAVKQFLGDDYAKVKMSLGLPNTDMEIISAELGRTYFSGQFGLTFAVTDKLSIYGNIDAGVNNKSANCYGNLGLALTL